MAYDIPSISDLEAIQLLNKHYAEVITSKEGGVSSAADITQTTNPITGVTRRTLYKILDDMDVEHDNQISAHELEHDNQISAHELEHDNQISAHETEHDNQISAHETEHDNQMQSFENDFDSRLAGMAFTRVGTFTAGATLTDMRQTLLWEVSQGGDGHEYGWTGAFTKVVAAGSNPSTSGGVGAGSWVDRTDDTFRDEIRETVFQNMKRSYAEAGFDLIGRFGSECTIKTSHQVILSRDGDVFAWKGELPKEIYTESTIENSGGIGDSSWLSVKNRATRWPLSMYGALSGIDNTFALQLASADLNGSGREIDIDGDYSFSGDIVLDNVYLIGTGSLSGTGRLYGVISNEKVPYDIIKCWNNVVTRSNRSSGDHSYDVVVDPILGCDLSATYVKTLQRSLNVISELVTTDKSRDYTIAIRSGRCELSENLIIPENLNGWGGAVDENFSTSQMKFQELTINADSTARYGLRIAPYLGEEPIICPPTQWFFPSMATSGYKKHAVVHNHTGVRFFKLFGADGIQRQCAGSWNRKTHALHRNQNRNVIINGSSPDITHSIRLPLALQEIVGAANAAELAAIRVRITHWFTSSWHVENMVLDGDTLSFKGYTTYTPYADGWAHIKADEYGAPFFIENLKAFISRDDEFSSTDSEVVLPNDDVAFFTTRPLTYAALLDFNSTNNVTIEDGISVKYVTGDPVQVASGTWGTKSNPYSAIRLGNYGAAYSPELYGLECDGIKLGKLGSLVKSAIAKKIGGNTITHVDGAHYSIVRGCIIEDHAKEQVGAFGICVTGKEIEISGNRITDGGFSAIRCDSAAFLTDQSFGNVMSGAIFNNLALSVGMRAGKLSERYPTGDTGVMTINGRGPATNYVVYSNVFGDCVGAGGSRAMFLDDGVNGTRIHHNVLFGAQDYSLDARQVGGNTRNNQVHNNLLVGDARLYDTGDGSVFSKNILFGNIDASEGIVKYGNSIASIDNPIICHQDDGFIKTNVQGNSLNTVLTEFTKPFVRKLSFMGI